MFKSARIYVLALVLVLVCAGAVGLVSSGVNLTNKQKRVDQLGTLLTNQIEEIASLYSTRSDLILKWISWIEEHAKAPTPAPAVAAPAAETAPGTDPSGAAAVPAAPTTATVPETPKVDPAVLNALKLAIEETRKIDLTSQGAFDRFDYLQSEIGNLVTSHLLEYLRQESARPKNAELAGQITAYEQAETSISSARRNYLEAAIERNALTRSLNKLSFGLGGIPQQVPVFSSDALARQQTLQN